MEIKNQGEIEIKSVRIPSNETDLCFRVTNSAQVAVPGEGGGGGGGKNKDGGLPHEMKEAFRKTRSCHDVSVFW